MIDRAASSAASARCSAPPTTARSGAAPTDPSHDRRAATRRSVPATSASSNSPRSAAWTRVRSIRSIATGSAAHSSRSIAGPHGRDDVDHLVGTLGERPHVERIGDRHALEAQIAPQQIGHDGPRQRRRQVVATGHGRQRHVRGHRQTRACGERRAERHELARLKGRARGADRGEPVVRIGGRFPRPRGVLHGGRDAGRLEAADHGRPVPRDERRVVAERPDPERRVRRVRRDVEHRGVDDVDAHRPRLGPDRTPDSLGQALRHRRRRAPCCRRTASSRPRDAMNCPPSWSAADEERRGRDAGRPANRHAPPPARASRQLPDLPRRPHVVVPEQRHAGHRPTSQPTRPRLRQHLPLEREHHPRQDRAAGLGAHPLTAPDSPRTK